MKVQVLVSTMNQTNRELVSSMRLDSDAVIINQCDSFAISAWDYVGGRILWIDLPERGIGLSRNNALMRATGDILLFADDDVTYAERYWEVIEREFAIHPDADAILFNLKSTNPMRGEYQNSHFHRLRFYNCLRYGTSRIAIKRDSVFKKRLSFSLLFGGGAIYGCGEDSLFLIDCLRKGLRLFASPLEIGTVSHRESTWFCGYDRKFFHDKGALFACISSQFAVPLCLQMCIRHKEMFSAVSQRDAFFYMREGIREFKSEKARRAGGGIV